MSSSERTVLATFCDDIRYEQGNKHSLMGCYKSDLVVEKLPAGLPKLCAAILVMTPLDRLFTKLTVRAMLDDEILGEEVLTQDQLERSQDELLRHPLPGMKRLGIQLHMVFSPFMISQPGLLKIEAETEEGLLNGGILAIRARENSANSVHS